MPLEVLPNLPQGHEAASAILLRFQPADPTRSTLEVLPHPSPDPGQATERVSFSHALVPGLGVIISGGEHPGPSGDPVCLRSSEVLLLETETLAELAVRLATGRSRHQAVLVRSGGLRSIFLLGGQSGTEGSQEFSDVEEIPLP
jgi:hypothetical protein